MSDTLCNPLPTCRWPVHLLAGSVAGLAEHCLMFPFDSVKTRLQSLCPCPETSCPTAMHSLMSMVKREGLLRSLKGVNAVVLGTIPAHAFYYTVYENSKAYLLNNPRVSNSMSYAISGALATVIHDAVMNPAEVVKQRMQMIFSPYGNSLECIRCIYIREGLRAFYRSYITQLTLNVPYQCTHFMIYEYMQNLLNPHHDYNPSSHLISGGIAGGIAAAITTPLDCVKTVLNTQQTPRFNTTYRLLTQSEHTAYYKGLADGIKTIYYLRGTGGFFRGLQARIIFQVPSTALSWSAYELCKYMLSIVKMSANGIGTDNITPRQNKEEHKLIPEPNLDNIVLSEGDAIHEKAKVMSGDSEPMDVDIFRTETLSERLKNGDTSDIVSAEEQTVVAVADCSSNFGDPVSASRVSSEDYGNDLHLDNEMGQTETDMQKSERIHVEQRRYFGGFMFGRDRHPNPELPKETVTILNYPFLPTAIPVGDDENEFRKSLADAKVYLIGTAHFSPDSQRDVLQTIASTQPDMVMVELCPSRISILSMDEDTLLEEAKNLNFDKIINTIKQSGAIQGILHVLLLSMSAHMTKTLGMAPGGEFRAAHKGAMDVKMCKLILGDRPIHVTVQRALGSLSFFQKLRLFYHIILSHKTTITQEEVERCKKSDMLEELLKQMAGEFPLLSKIFVEERDLYMTNALHTLLKKSTFDKRVAWSKTDAAWQPISVVAVVGMGHVPGIISNWNKRIDVGDLLIIPQPTHTEKFIRLTLKAMIIGVVGYVFYQVGSKVVNRVQMLIK